MRGHTYTMTDTKVHRGFQSTPSFFPNKNDEFNHIIKIMIKKDWYHLPIIPLFLMCPTPWITIQEKEQLKHACVPCYYVWMRKRSVCVYERKNNLSVHSTKRGKCQPTMITDTGKLSK